jgi:hypothetical protein
MPEDTTPGERHQTVHQTALVEHLVAAVVADPHTAAFVLGWLMHANPAEASAALDACERMRAGKP